MKTEKKILVIDDSETNNILIKSLFEHLEGYEVIALNNSKEVLHIIEKFLPDLILLDLMMPQKDGFTILKELKSIPVCKDIPVIIVSAKQEARDIELAMKLGASDYIRKPLGNNNLVKKVEAFFTNAL